MRLLATENDENDTMKGNVIQYQCYSTYQPVHCIIHTAFYRVLELSTHKGTIIENTASVTSSGSANIGLSKTGTMSLDHFQFFWTDI